MKVEGKMDHVKLEPCYWCGATDQVRLHIMGGEGDETYQVRCQGSIINSCGVSGPTCVDRSVAIDAWNDLMTHTPHTPVEEAKLCECPFCGGEPKEGFIRNMRLIRCTGCHSAGPWAASPIEAIILWNERAQSNWIDQ